jgi:hypothetical protein
MYFPRQHLIRQIEEVVRSIIRLKRPPHFRSNRFREQGEDLVEIVFRERGFIRHQSRALRLLSNSRTLNHNLASYYSLVYYLICWVLTETFVNTNSYSTIDE